MRDRKHFSGRNRASCPPLADSECAAAPCKKLSEKANAFFDKLKDAVERLHLFVYKIFSEKWFRFPLSRVKLK